jgi:hypothetical protein
MLGCPAQIDNKRFGDSPERRALKNMKTRTNLIGILAAIIAAILFMAPVLFDNSDFAK